MRIVADSIQLSEGELRLSLRTTQREALRGVQAMQAVLDRGKYLSVEIKPHREKRSLNANAYLWVLLAKFASEIGTTKDDLYLQMLDRYGVFTHVVVKPDVVERVKERWGTVREIGEVIVNGKTGVQLQCYFGSSTYNTKEMAVLIDGVVSECKECGIETLTPAELESMKAAWGKEEGNC